MSEITEINETNISYYLSRLARRYLDEGRLSDYISAMLEVEDKGEATRDDYFSIAQAYKDMGLNRLSINYCYKFLSTCYKYEQANAYKMLGENFYNIGLTLNAGHYYDLYISAVGEGELDYDETLNRFYEEGENEFKPEFYICYPPEDVSVETRKEKGDEFFLRKEYDKAINQYLFITNENASEDDYISSRVKLATAYFCKKEYEKALFLLENLAKVYPHNPYLILNLLGMNLILDRKEDGQRFIQNAKECEVEDVLAQKFGCCMLEYGEDEYGAQLLDTSLKTQPYDVNTLFLRGKVAYNLKKYEEAHLFFLKANSVSRSPIYKFFLKYTTDMIDGKHRHVKLDYDYNFPKKQMRVLVDRIAYIVDSPTKSIKTIAKDELLDIIDWSLTYSSECQQDLCDALLSTSSVFIRKHYISKLYDYNVSDFIKSLIITKLCERGYDKKIHVVIDGLFIKLQMLRAEFDKDNKAKSLLFNNAYALAFGVVAPYEAHNASNIRAAAYELYAALDENGNLGRVRIERELAAVIITMSNLVISKDIGIISKVFGVPMDRIRIIQKLAEAH